MKTLLLTTTVLLVGAAGLGAQGNPLSTEMKRIYAITRDNLMRAAEKVPEADYGFKPAPTVRTFGEEVAHAAQFQVIICGAAQSEQPANPAEGKTSKADLIAALKASAAYCDAVYDSVTDTTLAQPVKMFGRDFTKQGVLYFNAVHNNETYGTMVPYMRMKDIVPPTSEPAPAKKQ